MQLKSRRVDGLSGKSGPTQSGIAATKQVVGGVILPGMNYLVLGILALFVLMVGFFLFRKRNSIIKFLTPMLLRLTH